MPEYTAQIQAGTLIYPRQDLFGKWTGKHDGEWIRVVLEQLVKKRDPKSMQQLGFYWGLLVP